MQADEDTTILNPVVAKNIDFKVPSDGEVVYRMRQLAKERNITYTPSHDMMQALNSYLDLKGLPDPFDDVNSCSSKISSVNTELFKV